MELLIVTGMSGSGKSVAANVLEDMGYYCMDNIPPRIIPSLLNLSLYSSENLDKIAVVTDIRGGEMFKDITEVLGEIDKEVVDLKILFLETDETEIIRRYKENRRVHPLFDKDTASIKEAVIKEKQMLKDIRSRADFIINTTYMNASQLKQRISELFSDTKGGAMQIYCTSFGFKHGPAADADLVFDVRCLPNPFYDPELRLLTGTDKSVQDFVLSNDAAKEFYSRVSSFINYAVPLYAKEGKSSLVIAFGCTGGQHRSVTFAELICGELKEQGYNVSASHRDANKNKK